MNHGAAAALPLDERGSDLKVLRARGAARSVAARLCGGGGGSQPNLRC
jgi:hypothetical protein